MTKLRTFIVEDSGLIRESLIATLEEATETEVVGHADDERSALTWLENCRDRCDVVVVYVFLKTGSGLGVLNGLRLLSSAPRAVVLSNYATDDIRSRCLALGAVRVFDKSQQIEEMLAWFNEQGAIDTSLSYH